MLKPRPEHCQALFEPRGVVVAGATSHPGKSGFAAHHELKAMGFACELYGARNAGDSH